MSSQEPEVDTIRVDFHPHSGKPSEFYSFEDYGKRSLQDDFKLPPGDKPFQPFRTRGDFEFADLALHASLSNDQTDAFIKLIHRIISGEAKFTLEGSRDLKKMWELSSIKRTKVSRRTISIKLIID